MLKHRIAVHRLLTPCSFQLRPGFQQATSYPEFTYTGSAPADRDHSTHLLSVSPAHRTQLAPSRSSRSHHIPTQKNDLNSGFVPIFPSPELLIAHDVQPADLSRLLEDCHLMGKLSMRITSCQTRFPLRWV